MHLISSVVAISDLLLPISFSIIFDASEGQRIVDTMVDVARSEMILIFGNRQIHTVLTIQNNGIGNVRKSQESISK
jgi:hypothetical protein